MAKTKTDSLGEKQLGEVRRKEDEEKEPATERKREYTDLGLDLREIRQVTCHPSALALAVTDKEYREAEM